MSAMYSIIFKGSGVGLKKYFPGRELSPGLLRDRRGYSPLYYRGQKQHEFEQHAFSHYR